MSPPAANSPAAPIRLFQVWESADQRVPAHSLYSLVARPAPGEPGLKLEHLRHCSFVYRVTDGFVADLAFADGGFGPATLRAQSFAFRLVAIPGRLGLMPPADAEHLLELELARREWKFWSDFFFELAPGCELDPALDADRLLARYRQLSWHSLRLEQPFGAGFGEPFYKFRKRDSRYEFWVGARTGDIREHRAPDQPASP